MEEGVETSDMVLTEGLPEKLKVFRNEGVSQGKSFPGKRTAVQMPWGRSVPGKGREELIRVARVQ